MEDGGNCRLYCILLTSVAAVYTLTSTVIITDIINKSFREIAQVSTETHCQRANLEVLEIGKLGRRWSLLVSGEERNYFASLASSGCFVELVEGL